MVDRVRDSRNGQRYAVVGSAGDKMAPTKSFVALLKPYLAFGPAYLMFNVALELSDLVRANLYLQKTCRHNRTLHEPDLRTPCDDERAGIDFVTAANARYTFAAQMLATVLIVFMSAWSDKSSGRRKFCILFPMALKTAQLCSMCLQSYFWQWPVWMAVLTDSVLTAAIPMRVACMIHVCATSSNEQRTNKMTTLYVLMIFATFVSSGSSGYFLHYCGFFYTYVFCATLSATSTVLFAAFVENTSAESTLASVKSVHRFFNYKPVVDAFRLVFRKRDGYERTVIWLLSLMSIVGWSTYVAEVTVVYLYLRYKFGWNEKQYGVYNLYKLIGNTIGSLICLGMSKFFKIGDYTLGIFATICSTIAVVSYIFATENWQFYVIPLLDIFRVFAIGLCDSLQSKFFGSDEFGRLFSVHEALNIAVAFAYPAFNFLFNFTMDVAPTSIFMLNAALLSIMCALFGICRILIGIRPKNIEKTNNEESLVASNKSVSQIN